MNFGHLKTLPRPVSSPTPRAAHCERLCNWCSWADGISTEPQRTVMTKLCQSTWNAITHRNRDQTEEAWCSQRYATKGSRKQWKSVGDQYQPPGTMTPTKRQIKHRDWKHELKAQTCFCSKRSCSHPPKTSQNAKPRDAAVEVELSGEGGAVENEEPMVSIRSFTRAHIIPRGLGKVVREWKAGRLPIPASG